MIAWPSAVGTLSPLLEEGVNCLLLSRSELVPAPSLPSYCSTPFHNGFPVMLSILALPIFSLNARLVLALDFLSSEGVPGDLLEINCKSCNARSGKHIMITHVWLMKITTFLGRGMMMPSARNQKNRGEFTQEIILKDTDVTFFSGAAFQGKHSFARDDNVCLFWSLGRFRCGIQITSVCWHPLLYYNYTVCLYASQYPSLRFVG